MGKVTVAGAGPIFKSPHTLFMKDVCNISVKAPAVTAFQDDEGILMATAKFGKGTVFATVDPWLYNEYTMAATFPLHTITSLLEENLFDGSLNRFRSKFRTAAKEKCDSSPDPNNGWRTQRFLCQPPT